MREAITVHKSLVTLTPANHLKLVKIHNSERLVDSTRLKGEKTNFSKTIHAYKQTTWKGEYQSTDNTK